MEFELTLSKDQWLVTGAALHLLSHFAKDDSPPKKTIDEVRNAMIELLPEDGEVDFSERISSFCKVFYSCAYCERVQDTLGTINDMLHRQAEMEAAEKMGELLEAIFGGGGANVVEFGKLFDNDKPGPGSM